VGHSVIFSTEGNHSTSLAVAARGAPQRLRADQLADLRERRCRTASARRASGL